MTDYMADFADYERALAQRVREAQALSASLAALRGTGAAAEGLVRAEAAPGGRLTGLTIEPRAMRLDSATLTEAVLAAAEAAGTDADRKAAEAVGGDPAGPSWEEILNGEAEPAPQAPLPPLPDPARFERMIREAAERRIES